MERARRVLVAEDEESFGQLVSEILERRGYECRLAADGASATSILESESIDLLIADIRMPGNDDLELVRAMPRVAPGVPTILMTGYPSVDTARAAIGLPVTSYLVKPFEAEDLERHVDEALRRAEISASISARRRDGAALESELDRLAADLKCPDSTRPDSGLQAFAELSMRNMLGSLQDLRALLSHLVEGREPRSACHLFDCPGRKNLLCALRATVQVLERTKQAFKSKELGELRRRLVEVIEHCE